MSPQTSPPLIEGRGLTKTFGEFVAVDDVTLQVQPGEVVGLLGANGAGKTTAIRMLLGLLRPTAGVVRLLGGPPGRTARRRLGYVPQGLGLYETLTVRQNLAFSAQAYGTPVARTTGPLATLEDQFVGSLSLGLQRQVAFTSALQHSPEVLVLDEPTSGVEPLARARLWDRIHLQTERGVGVLVTTHYMQEAEQCDRLLLMSRGRLVAQGTERDLVGTTTATEVSTSDWSRVFQTLIAADLPVTLAGQIVRVANTDPARIREILAESGIAGEVREVPATIEERMTMLARQTPLIER